MNNSTMLIFFYRIGHKDQIPIKLVQMLCKVAHQRKIHRIPAFHIGCAPAKHPFAGFNIR